jgi:hypothetical protein
VERLEIASFLTMPTYQLVVDPNLEVDDDLHNHVLTDQGPDLDILEEDVGRNLFTRNANRLKKAKQLKSRNLWIAGLSIIGFLALILVVRKIRHAHKSRSETYTRLYEQLFTIFCSSE